MRIGIFHFFIFWALNLSAQTTQDSLKETVYLMDTMWTTGFTKRDPLSDSLSYFYMKGGRVEYRYKAPWSEYADKGRIFRWKEEIDQKGMSHQFFYIVDRGFLKASLTVKIHQLSAETFEIHIVNASSTFDRRFLSRKGSFNQIIQPSPKKLRPKST